MQRRPHLSPPSRARSTRPASRRVIGIAALAALAVISAVVLGTTHSGASIAAACDDPGARIALLAGDGEAAKALQAPQISCLVPKEVQGSLRQPLFSTRQRATNLFAWQTFLGVQWPARRGDRGEPDPSVAVTALRPAVWETWKESSEIFLPGGATPRNWSAPPPPPPAACRADLKLLVRTQKVNDVLDDALQPTIADDTLPGTLKDQRGNLVRYEIRYNRTAFEYIVDHRLYDSQVQAVAPSVVFPPHSILVKAAWRELADGEAGASRYQSTGACICGENAAQPTEACREATVGLVGFHVMQKTTSAPQWIWSTFEQVDNVPPRRGDVASSFYAAGCTPSDRRSCAVNQQTPAGVANQVQRVTCIPGGPGTPAEPAGCTASGPPLDDLVTLNHEIAAALATEGSPLQFYELVNAQWPVTQVTPAAAAPGADGARSAEFPRPATEFDVLPPLLANTTLETFIQESSSCMGCHSMARTSAMQQRGEFVSADFTFTLNNAQPTLVNRVNVTPADPSQLSPQEKRGYDIATRTFELLPEHVGNRLHCSSCHLAAGGDPTASWWVGMQSAYAEAQQKDGTVLAYPESLQARINGCFERSMNGRALCEPGSGCANDPSMAGLIAYMEALDARAADTYAGTTPRGFPQLLTASGDPARGKATFLQKCAFCHGVDGQGRYADGADPSTVSYYRPALWGPDSFNACAGMAKPTNLAAFLRSNMPLGSGGELTDGEAWDLAEFIDGQCRPGKGPVGGEACTPTPGCVDGQRTAPGGASLPPAEWSAGATQASEH